VAIEARQRFGGEHRLHRPLQRAALAEQQQTGTPISAVSTPTGSCCGAITVRAAVSARVSRVPPASAAAGISTRWSLPSASRTRCGTTRPTKPTDPTSVTAVAVSSEAST
jgi:hypothetical protein